MNERGRRVATVALLIVGIAALLVSIILPTLSRMQQTGGRSPDVTHLRQIGQAILLHSLDHDGECPARIEDLVIEGHITPDTLICPDSYERAARGGTAAALSAEYESPGHISYVYRPPGIPFSSLSRDYVLVYEPVWFHDEEGCNALMGDGSVRWFEREEFKRQIRIPATQP